MLERTVDLLVGISRPWIVENVRDAIVDLQGVASFVLCGSSFGLGVRRHRVFASSELVLVPECRHDEQGTPIGVYGSGGAYDGRGQKTDLRDVTRRDGDRLDDGPRAISGDPARVHGMDRRATDPLDPERSPMSDDLDPRPTRTRTAWETEHEDDPPDDVERFDEVPLPGVEVDPVDWIEVAARVSTGAGLLARPRALARGRPRGSPGPISRTSTPRGDDVMAVDLSGYVPVADRLAKLFADHPDAYLRPLDLRRPYWIEEIGGATFLVYAAACYYDAADKCPGIGMAWEPFPGKTPYTRDSELQNAETSAWGRAIVAKGAADTGAGIASRDEVQARDQSETGERLASENQIRAFRTRDRGTRSPGGRPVPDPVRPASDDAGGVGMARPRERATARIPSSGAGLYSARGSGDAARGPARGDPPGGGSRRGRSSVESSSRSV